jgi:hypothetical protein
VETKKGPGVILKEGPLYRSRRLGENRERRD